MVDKTHAGLGPWGCVEGGEVKMTGTCVVVVVEWRYGVGRGAIVPSRAR